MTLTNDALWGGVRGLRTDELDVINERVRLSVLSFFCKPMSRLRLRPCRMRFVLTWPDPQGKHNGNLAPGTCFFSHPRDGFSTHSHDSTLIQVACEQCGRAHALTIRGKTNDVRMLSITSSLSLTCWMVLLPVLGSRSTPSWSTNGSGRSLAARTSATRTHRTSSR